MRKTVKQILGAALSASVLLSSFGAVYAEENTQTETGEEQKEEKELTWEEQKELSYSKVPDTNQIEGWPAGPQVYGEAAVVMDMDTGAVLFEKNSEARYFPASITKLLTALVALENAEMEDEVLFSEDSVSFLEYGDASIGMTPGEILSMEDALYGMLLASANEVSYAIAESTGKKMGGDYSTFIQAMNDRAAQLGCTGSHWTNANGLHNDEHYTTAKDMAKIASAVYQFEEFRKITQTLNYTIGETNLMKETRTFQQNHKMLWPENLYYYEYCTGGKTGYTDQSGTTLVTMADNGSLRLAAVVLRNYGVAAYEDTKAMFEYGFGNFEKIDMKQESLPDGVKSYKDETVYVTVPKGTALEEVETKIEITDEKNAEGTVGFWYKGQPAGSAKAVLTDEFMEKESGYSVKAEKVKQVKQAKQEKGEEKTEKKEVPFAVKFLILTVTAVIVLWVLFALFLNYLRKKRRRMRKRRRKPQTRRRPDRRKKP